MFISTLDLEVDIRLKGNELSAIAHSLRDSLRGSVESHYKRFDLEVFIKQEGYKIDMMETMFGLIGQGNTGHEYTKEMKKLIKDEMLKKKDKPCMPSQP